MQWFNQLRVTTRLIAGFLVVSVIGAIIGLLGVVNMGRMTEWTGKIYNSDLQALKAVQDGNINLVYASRAQIALLSASTMGERATERDARQRNDVVRHEPVGQRTRIDRRPGLVGDMGPGTQWHRARYGNRHRTAGRAERACPAVCKR